MAYEYLKDPEQITRASFAQIGALPELERFGEGERQVAMRLVHTCGDPSIAEDLVFSADAVDAGVEAMRAAAPVLCDVEMLRQGINGKFCKGETLCFLNRPDVTERATRHSVTRSMAALDHWREYLPDSVAAVGNAPTALFRLLELLEEGVPPPALVIGMPVGFVGAAESKQALVDRGRRHGLRHITLRGRRGGSPAAATTVNALARMAAGVHQ